MRLFFWPLATTIVLLFVFIEVALPILKPNYDSNNLSHQLPIHKTLYLDREIYGDEILYITQAAIEWKEATNDQVVFDIKKLPADNIDLLNSIIISNVTPDNPEIIFLDVTKNMSTLGYFNNDIGISYIALVDERLNNEDYSQVVMHELGHAIGLSHIEDANGIGTLMYPNINHCSKHITYTDLEKFCDLYGCNVKNFHSR